MLSSTRLNSVTMGPLPLMDPPVCVPLACMEVSASQQSHQLSAMQYLSIFYMGPALLESGHSASVRVAAGRLSKVPVSWQVFEQFLAGDTLEECYAAVASVADRWLDLLDTQVLLSSGLSCDDALHLAAVWHLPCLPAYQLQDVAVEVKIR